MPQIDNIIKYCCSFLLKVIEKAEKNEKNEENEKKIEKKKENEEKIVKIFKNFSRDTIGHYNAFKISVLKEQNLISSLREKHKNFDSLNYSIIHDYISEAFVICNEFINKYVGKSQINITYYFFFFFLHNFLHIFF